MHTQGQQSVRRASEVLQQIRGVTVLELMIVLMIMAIVATVAMPTFRPAEQQKLALATAEAADAIRFAREESIRTGTPHGITGSVAAGQYRIFRLDTSVAPATWLFDVYHPTAKQPYWVAVDSGSTSGVTMTQADVNFLSACNNDAGFVFGSRGNPICTDPLTTSAAGAVMVLRYGGTIRSINVAPITGRVTVQ